MQFLADGDNDFGDDDGDDDVMNEPPMIIIMIIHDHRENSCK